MITDDIKEKILQRADIVEIIGDVVELKKRGSRYLGLCPFHNEKTPSFIVSEDRGIYKCFGCGEYGDVFTFYMKYKGLTFVEAMEELAKRYGITIPKKISKKESAQTETRHDLAYKATKTTAEYFNKMLYSTSGRAALEYFKKRGFTDELIKNYTLGYCPDSWDSLYNYLMGQGFNVETMLDAGLIIENTEKQSFYDRFRNRAVFPIHDKTGKIIGFGARQLGEDKTQPKYINSPQSIIYDKSRSLYGYYHALGEIRTKNFATLVEGYADVLSLHQAGFKTAIASSGTALTSEQLHALPRNCKKLYIVYDSDNAGRKATEKAIEIALPIGFDVQIVSLPDGEDPDSLIKNHGARLFQVYVDSSKSFLNFLLESYKTQGLLDSPAERADTIRKLLGIISRIPDRLQHDEYIGILSSDLNLTERQIQNIYKEKVKIEKKAVNSSAFRPKQEPINNSDNVSGFDQVDNQINIEELLPEERILLQVMLNLEEAIELIMKKFNMAEDDFITNKAKNLFSVIYENHSQGKDIVISIKDNEEILEGDKNDIINLTLAEVHISENWPKFGREIPEADLNKTILDCISNLKLKHIENELNDLKSKINSSDNDQIIVISKRITDLKIMKNQIVNNLSSF
jgi:DNA primase